MGVSSLGWAIISREDESIDCGVRVFPAGIEKFGTGKDTHLNQERRKARGARRRIHRKAKRKELIRAILSDLGWIPTSESDRSDWENLDVYELRCRALREKITTEEMGRIILHLNQRRGFLSLRKSEVEATEGEEKKTLEGMLGEISELQSEIEHTFPDPSQRTLGNYLHHLREKEGGAHGNLIRLRARHIRRQMLHHEFNLIWQIQSHHHPVLSDALRYGTHGPQDDPTSVVKPVPRKKTETLLEQFGLENLTFFQRRVYWPTSSIGQCELEEGELRAPVADRRFEEFRMLSELNNLRILDQSFDGKPEERRLEPEERETALSYLSSTQKPSLSGLKKKIAKLPSSPEASQITFNLEKDQRDTIGGLPTDLKLAKTFGPKDWGRLSDEHRNRIVEILTLPEPGAKKVIQRTDDETKDLLKEIPGLSPERIESLLRVSLPTGYCNLSIKALEKLLPYMRDGLVYQAKNESDSARHRAGYPRRDEDAVQKLPLLPLLGELTNPKSERYDRHFPQVNNPLILRCLHELRKVVNAVVRKYGPPAHIHIEMARDLKMSAKQREEHARKNNEHKKSRELAAAKLEENGIVPTRDAILLYRLWLEQDERCLYSGKPISFSQLVGGDADIDHIYPRRANDDSYMNKVVCFSKENREKGDRLPSEWLGEHSEKFQEIVQRSSSLPYAKRKRLMAEKLPEGFADRDMVDTAYMTRVARHYLTYLVDAPHQVLGIKGRHTAFLRKHWQLNHLLRNDLLDLKNREDHRHHALDAIVIALCNRSFLQKISRELMFEQKWKTVEEDGQKKRVYCLKPTACNLESPWSGFQRSVETSLNAIWVSHRPDRKVSGPLHQETNYGATANDGVLVRRKKISELKPKELNKIRDPEVARIVMDYRTREKRLFRADFGKKLTDEIAAVFVKSESIGQNEIAGIEERKLRLTLEGKLKKKNPLQDAELGKITFPNGLPIRKARLLIPNRAAVPLRQSNEKELVIPGNTHHLAIFSLGDGKYHFEPVTLLEAANRKRKGLPIIDQKPPRAQPEGEFALHLCYNDSISCEIEDRTEVFVFKGVHATQLTAKFVHHRDGRKNNEKDPATGKSVSIQRTCKPNTFEMNFPKARKVDILPNGDLRRCQ